MLNIWPKLRFLSSLPIQQLPGLELQLPVHRNILLKATIIVSFSEFGMAFQSTRGK
jgi:hypothetical protein